MIIDVKTIVGFYKILSYFFALCHKAHLFPFNWQSEKSHISGCYFFMPILAFQALTSLQQV